MPTINDINKGLHLLAEQFRAEGHGVLAVNHLPDLAAWARATAPSDADVWDLGCAVQYEAAIRSLAQDR